MNRQIVLDTETTGIGHEQGHRIIEIGCIELLDRKFTGTHYHVYLNPERSIDEGAFRVHGISNAFVQDKPLFKDVVSEFIQYVEGSELIIHNAAFDVGFLNAELRRLQWDKPLEHYCTVLDTLALAREKHPGQRNSLDSLCKRYDVDNSNRQLHGALLDAELLALVYLAMTGGQGNFFTEIEPTQGSSKTTERAIAQLTLRNPVVLEANPEELESHREFIKFLVEKSGINYWESQE